MEASLLSLFHSSQSFSEVCVCVCVCVKELQLPTHPPTHIPTVLWTFIFLILSVEPHREDTRSQDQRPSLSPSSGDWGTRSCDLCHVETP